MSDSRSGGQLCASQRGVFLSMGAGWVTEALRNPSEPRMRILKVQG